MRRIKLLFKAFSSKPHLLNSSTAVAVQTTFPSFSSFPFPSFVGLLQAAGGVGDLFFNTATMAEATAIYAALLVCTEVGCDEVEVESDSKVIISILNGECMVDATLKYFIHDIGNLVSQLEEVRFVFVKRSGNVVAHVVASHGGAFC